MKVKKRLLAFFFKIPHEPLGASVRDFRNLGLWQSQYNDYRLASKKLYELHLSYLNPTPGKKLLELACGMGTHLENLAKSFELACADGIDLQADLELTKPPLVKLYREDLRKISKLPLQDYDYLLSVDASYHFLKVDTPLAAQMKAKACFVFTGLIAHPPKAIAKLYFYLLLAGLKLFRIEAFELKDEHIFGGLKIYQQMDLTEPVLGGFSRFYLSHRTRFSLKIFLSALLCRVLERSQYFSYRLILVRKD